MTTQRPTENDAIVAEAAREAAIELLGLVAVPSHDESPEQVQGRIASEIIALRMEMRSSTSRATRILAERLGFEPTPEVEDLVAGFATSVANLVAEKIREWVSESNPKAPFPASAHVTLTPEGARRWGVTANVGGVAIRTLELDRSAYLRFIPTPLVEEFISSKGRRGHVMVPWELVASARPVSDELEIEAVKTARQRERDLVAHAPSRQPDDNPKPISRDLVSPEHGKHLVTLLDAAKDALTGSDEHEARSALIAIQQALQTLARHEQTRGRVRLTTPVEPGLRP